MKLDAMQQNRQVESGYSCKARTLSEIDLGHGEFEQEHFNFWYGLRKHPKRMTEDDKKKILSTAPYKMMLYDAVINP